MTESRTPPRPRSHVVVMVVNLFIATTLIVVGVLVVWANNKVGDRLVVNIDGGTTSATTPDGAPALPGEASGAPALQDPVEQRKLKQEAAKAAEQPARKGGFSVKSAWAARLAEQGGGCRLPRGKAKQRHV